MRRGPARQTTAVRARDGRLAMSAAVKATSDVDVPASAAARGAERVIAKALADNAFVALWIFVSALVILFNKYILTVYGFPFPVTLTMTHMLFCSSLAFVLVRVVKVVPASEGMTRDAYAKKIVPIAALFATSLWASNTAYVYLSVAFIQMLKALSPVTVYSIGCAIGIEQYTHKRLLNMAVVTVGVMIASYGELNFNAFGFFVQIVAVVVEACRIISVQLVLGKANLKLNSITTLYYVSPMCFVFLIVPFAFLELPKLAYGLEITHSIHYSAGVMIANASCAFALNAIIYLLIGRTSALTLNISGVLKDIILIAISAVIFESPVSSTQLVGSTVAFSGVCYYNYRKVSDALAAAATQTSRAQASKGDDKL